MKTKKIYEVVDLRRGASPRPIQDFLASEGAPWVKISDATASTGRYINKTKEYIKEEGTKYSVEVLPEQLILSNSTTPGLPKIMGIKAYVHDGWLVFDNYNGVIRDYLYYYFINKRNELVNQANGSVFRNLKTDIVKNFDIQVPSLEQQTKIGNILSSFDKKIELNTRINKNLHNICQLIFYDMFVNNKHKKQKPNLILADIVDDFIAGDWGKENIRGNFNKGVLCVIGMDLPSLRNGVITDISRRYILDKNFNAKKLRDGDLIVEISGGSSTQSTGRAAIVHEYFLNNIDTGLVCTNFCKALRPKYEYRYFLYFYWIYLYDLNIFFFYENGTTGIKNLDLNSFLKQNKVLLPSKETLNTFNKFCYTAFNMICSNSLENSRLSECRDAILPKLMSGEFCIKEYIE